MTHEELERLRTLAENRPACMGSGDHRCMSLPRETVIALIDEIDRVRQELGDECDRLVIEWAEKVQELEARINELEER